METPGMDQHLSADDWDVLLAGSASERTKEHLDGCSECQSIADRLARDAMPTPALLRRRGNYLGSAVLASGATAIAGALAVVYGAAYVQSEQREAALSARILVLEAQASASDPATAATMVAGSNESTAELGRLRETLKQLQTDAVAVASLRTQMDVLKQQLTESENRHVGDEATLEHVRADYEAKLGKNARRLSEIRAELASTQSKLATALKPRETENPSAQSVESALAVYARSANVPSVLLAGTKARTAHDPGFIVLTADTASVAAMRRLLAANQNEPLNEYLKAYFVSEDSVLERCLSGASSTKVLKMDLSAASSQAYYSAEPAVSK